MKKIRDSGSLRRYLLETYAGMFAGVLFLTAIAMTSGLASNLMELGNLLLLSLGSAFLLMLAHFNFDH